MTDSLPTQLAIARAKARPLHTIIWDCDGDPWIRTLHGFRCRNADGELSEEWAPEILVRRFGPLTTRQPTRTRNLVIADSVSRR